MRVRLREIRESDLSFLNACRNKYGVSKYLNHFCPKSIDSERQWFDTAKDEVHFTIEADNGEAAGQVSLIHFSHKEKQAEFTIFVDDPFWGKGYGKVATRLMLHYGFSELNLHKIFLHVYEGNESAKSIYESVGFVQEGKLRDFVFKGGRYLSAYYFGILSHEFLTPENVEGIFEPLLYVDPKG